MPWVATAIQCGFRDQITMRIPVEAAVHRGCGLLLKKTSATLAVVK
jgi:hypothetical protein